MATLPWQKVNPITENSEYVVMLTHLPLKHYKDTFRFAHYTWIIGKQLRKTPGLIGFSLKAHLLHKDFWTLSVWKNEASIGQYVHTAPHSEVMQYMKGGMGKTSFNSWTIQSNELPLRWSEAISRTK